MYEVIQGFVWENGSVPLALCFRVLMFALRIIVLLRHLLLPLGASFSLADVCKHLVVFCRQHALH